MKEHLAEIKQIGKSYIRTLRYLLKINFFSTITFFFSTLVLAFAPFASAYVISKIIDAFTTTNDYSSIIPLLKYLAGIWIGILVIKSVFEKLQEYMNMRVVMNFGREFDNEVTKKFAFLDLEYYEDPAIATLIEKVRVHYAGEPLNFVNQSFQSLVNLIKIIAAITILGAFSPIFVILLIASTVPQFVNSLIFGKNLWYIWSAREELRKNYSGTRKYLHDYTYLLELAVFRIRDFLLNRLKELHREFQEEKDKLAKKKIFYGLLLDILKIAGLSIPFVILLSSLIASSITLGLFSFYLSTMQQLQSSAEEFFKALANIYNSGLFVNDIYKFLDLPDRISNGEIEMKKSDSPPVIDIKNITFRYPLTNRDILENFSLKIEPGEHVAIVGENGAGKTTLIKLLMRFYDVNSGEIKIGDNSLKDLKLETWYQNVGTLFQEFNKYHYDAKTNIGLGDISRMENLEEIKEAAKKSSANTFIEKFDKKYDQMLNRVFEGGIDLSGGQWQKVAIARAFFKNPSVLILDEPTSAIDPKSEAEIFENIFEFTKGKTVIIVSHRFSTVRNASRILVMDQGKIIEEGTHDNLMKIDNGVYKTAFEIQRKGYL